MKKLQMLTLLILLGSVYEMQASQLKLNAGTSVDGKTKPNTIKIPVFNKSNMHIQVNFKVNKGGDSGFDERKSNILAPGSSFSLTGFQEGDSIRSLIITYYSDAEGKKPVDTKNIEITGAELFRVSGGNVEKQRIAEAIYVYGNSAAKQGTLSTVPATETTQAVSVPSRFIAYWMGSASQETEATGAQPVTMYCLTIDGKFTTTSF